MEARDADELSVVHRTAPTTCFQVLKVSSAKVEKPELEGEQEWLQALNQEPWTRLVEGYVRRSG